MWYYYGLPGVFDIAFDLINDDNITQNVRFILFIDFSSASAD